MPMNYDDKSAWTEKNGSMSDKSAREEFGLSQDEIIRGIQAGKLQYRENNTHGNPYFKLLRREVEAFVDKKYGKKFVENKLLEKEIKDVNRELNAAKRKISMLEKKKADLLNKKRIKNNLRCFEKLC